MDIRRECRRTEGGRVENPRGAYSEESYGRLLIYFGCKTQTFVCLEQITIVKGRGRGTSPRNTPYQRDRWPQEVYRYFTTSYTFSWQHGKYYLYVCHQVQRWNYILFHLLGFSHVQSSDYCLQATN